MTAGAKKVIVITTINDATPAVDAFAALDEWSTVIVGDRKTPNSWAARNDVLYLDLDSQNRYFPDMASALPFDHYSRKNIGYLHAISERPEVIAESDDDNRPLANWGVVGPESGAYATVTGPRIANIYQHFSDAPVWPRGYPLDLVLSGQRLEISRKQQTSVAIEQQLVHGEPDVDAIYRLVVNENPQFGDREPIVMDEGVFAPFNSQNTFWRKLAFPFLYMPCNVTFRFTDILRGWVAQRCIWMLGGRLAFSSATVFQDRNEHDLLIDFESEIPVYLDTYKVLSALEAVPGTENPGEALMALSLATNPPLNPLKDAVLESAANHIHGSAIRKLWSIDEQAAA
ncbi:MAG: hypothetical protein IIC71_01270, partial [Acidobacteria bacterium]|nr:hypothetical protein [Acidobacteriota bacterium]